MRKHILPVDLHFQHTHTYTRKHQATGAGYWQMPPLQPPEQGRRPWSPKRTTSASSLEALGCSPLVWGRAAWKALQGNPLHALWYIKNAASSSPLLSFGRKAEFEGTGKLERQKGCFPPGALELPPSTPPLPRWALTATAPMGQQLLHPFPLLFTPAGREEGKQNSKNNCQSLKKRKA